LPTATHDTGLTQVTACNWRGELGRFGVGCTLQAEPPDPSASVDPSLIPPTAVHSAGAVHVMPASAASLTLPAGCIFHAAPFHASISAVSVFADPVNHPTAVHEFAPLHATPSR
jgi:hypothetical protein